jgi:hypothetical protein
MAGRWMAMGVALALGGALVAAPAEGQEGWSFEVNGGGAFGTGTFLEADLGTGLMFEATVGYRLLPHLAVYAGWDWVRFATEQSLLGPDLDVEETGYVFGARFEHPFRGEGGEGLLYRVRLGGTYSHIEIEDGGGTRIADSGHGPGWEAGLALVVPAGEKLRLTPGFRYRSLSRDIRVATLDTPAHLRYFTMEMGVALSF